MPWHDMVPLDLWGGMGVVSATGSSGYSAWSGPRTPWPGAQPDQVDYGRAVLSAITYASREKARDVHILRLRNAFDRAGFVNSLRYVLNVLTLMREVQELRGGYWFPTPVRFVRLGQTALIIAPTTTDELARHFPDIEKAGYARFLTLADEINLPEQSLDDWIGLEPTNAADWARGALQHGLESMATTIHPENLEFFSLERIPSLHAQSSKICWVRDFRRASYPDKKTVLCRTRLGENHYRYFLGHIENGRLLRESTAPVDIDRLQYGIAALINRPITVSIKAENSIYVVSLFSALPRPERRLLLALAKRVGAGYGKVYKIKNDEHSRLIVKTLLRLGCELK